MTMMTMITTMTMTMMLIASSPSSSVFSSLLVFAGVDEDDDDNHDDDNDCDHCDDAIRILIRTLSLLIQSRAGQFLNMKNWDDSTNYSIPIARCS